MDREVVAKVRARAARRALAGAAAAVVAVAAGAGDVRAERPRVTAIAGARIVVAPGRVVEKGTIVLRDGLIESVGAEVSAPPDAVVVDGAGRTVHAGFIDACASVGLPERDGERRPGPGAGGVASGGREAQAGAAHPIARIHPERRVVDLLAPEERAFERHRNMGFTAALAVPPDGLFRGSSALIALRDGPVRSIVIRPEVAQHVAFERGGFGEGYPTSLMGAVAAIRQGFEDARRHEVWRARWEADPRGLRRPGAVSAWGPIALAASGRVPVVIETGAPANAPRAISLAREQGLSAILVGSGADYEVIEAIRDSGYPVILPLAFPDRPDVAETDAALDVETRELERYLGARGNPGRLAAAGIPIALATCGMKNAAEFPANLRRAIDAGLGEEAALAALTTTPARLLGVERSMGTLEPGKAADVVVRAGGLFGEGSKVVRVFVDGVEYAVEEKTPKGDPDAKVDPRGTWSVTLAFSGRAVTRTWTIAGSAGAWEGTAETREGTVPFRTVTLKGNLLTVTLESARGTTEITVVITGDAFEGTGEGSSGSFPVTGTRISGPGGTRSERFSCVEEGGDL